MNDPKNPASPAAVTIVAEPLPRLEHEIAAAIGRAHPLGRPTRASVQGHTAAVLRTLLLISVRYAVQAEAGAGLRFAEKDLAAFIHEEFKRLSSPTPRPEDRS